MHKYSDHSTVVTVGSGGGQVCTFVCTNCLTSDKGNIKDFDYLESTEIINRNISQLLP